MTDVLFGVIVPTFVVVAVGALLGRAFRLDMTPLNRIALYATVPALVFMSLARAEVAFADVGTLLGGGALYYVGMAATAWFVVRGFPDGVRRGLMATSLFGNAANIMLPVTLFAFGEEGLQRALLLYVFTAVVIFTLGPLVLGGGSRSRRLLVAAVLRLPVLWAALLGLTVNLAGVSVPVGVERGLGLLGDAAIPLVLLTLGLQIQRSGVRLPSTANVVGTFLKLAVGPFIGYAGGLIVGARGMDLAVLTLLAAMPPAINNFMLALEFGSDAQEVASTVILSTLAAVGTLTVVLVVLRALVL